MSLGNRFLHSALVLTLVASLVGFAGAQQAAPRQRISQSIDNTRLTKLAGSTHPLARAEFDRGRAPDSLPADRMLLLLSRTPEQESALAQLLDDQQTAGSPNYRRWLTPEEFGQKFGAADADIQTITAWLQTQGFQVSRVSGSRNIIEFSGTAGQVRSALHTELHKYNVGGKEYWANATDPKIPAALATVVKGVVSLNNFPHKPQYKKVGSLSPIPLSTFKSEFTVSDGTTTYYAVGPADFATIYKTNSLISAGTKGTGQTIAIIGETNIDMQDINDFRSFFSLTGGTTSVVVDGTDPGIVPGEVDEAVLDVQWAGAVAPGADVKLVTAQQTTTTAGIFLAANYAIQQNIGGVLSLSYGSCEMSLGTAGNQFMQAIWQQAAAQGITVLVSSGDEGSAGCDYHGDAYIAQTGLGVNGFASTPYNIAVGGTDFDDATSLATYWNANNNTVYGSAKSYIPEKTWNATCAANATATNLGVCPTITDPNVIPDGISVVAASGGASNCARSTYSNGVTTCQSGTPKPSWQSGTGVPNDGVRDIPDVSLFSASGDTASKSFYVIAEGGYFYPIGGTSAAAPSFAGMVALFNQKAGTRLGNLNYLLYSIAAKSGSSCSSSASEATTCVFNDVVKGNISVPCVAGSPNCSVTSGTATGVLVDTSNKPAFTTTAGYDLATGLGSVNAANLATAIANAKGSFTPTTTALTLNSNTTTVTAKHGDPINIAVNVTPTTATGPVSVQNGTGQQIDNATLVTGSSAWSSTLFPGGNYAVQAHYPGDGTRGASDSNSVQVNISPEDSKTFLEVINWDDNGHLLSYFTPTLAYGSPYIVRMDVGDAAASVSSTSGVSSKCWNGTASCPTGTLTLTANGSALDGGTFKLNSAGHAEDQLIQLVPGSYSLIANYPGDASYNPSSATANLTVSKAPVNISFTPQSSLNSVAYGTSAMFDVKVAASGSGVAPTGNVTMLDNGSSVYLPGILSPSSPQTTTSPAYSIGTAGLQFLGIGNRAVNVQYSGDPLYSGNTSTTINVQVVKATPSISGFEKPNPTATQLPVLIQCTVQGTAAAPTGTVTILDNGTPLSANLTYQSSGMWLNVSTSYTFAQTGAHNLTLNYSGDDKYNAISGAALGTVNVFTQVPTSMFLPNADFSPTLVNQSVGFHATVDSAGGPTPSGTITFYDNGTPFSEPVTYTPMYMPSYLTANTSHTFSTSGTHNITASYSGDNNTAASSSQPLAYQVVDKIPTTAQMYGILSGVQNQPTTTTLNAYPQTRGVGNWPPMTGSFTVLENGTALDGTITTTPGTTGNPSLYGSFVYTFTTTGTHNLTVQYSGDANYASSQSAVTAVNITGLLSINLLIGDTLSLPRTGGTSSYVVAVSNTGAATENVTLSCTPDSQAAACSFQPSALSISSHANSTSALSLTVPALTATKQRPAMPWRKGYGYALGGILACTVLFSKSRRRIATALLLVLLGLAMLSCGGGSSSGGGGNAPTSKTYRFTIKATDGTNTATQVITVTVGS